MQYLRSHPLDAIKYFQLRREPSMEPITSPLIEYLEQMSPAERLQWRRIGLLRSVGYEYAGRFENAEHLLQWLKPKQYLVGNESTPAENRRIKGFTRRITDEMFAVVCQVQSKRYTANPHAAPAPKGGGA